tara:strand:+ start:258582 stop:259268 length:687 start_codon:yes stop_codon:yes gene_type:complete
MKTLIHLALILALGVAIGLGLRALKPTSEQAGPGPDEQVFTNDVTTDQSKQIEASDVEKASITRPPEDEEWLSRFELLERSGEMVKSEDLIGKPYVVSFFFSTCPSICVQQNQKLKELQDEFEDKDVRFLAISVDPEHDRPEQLREYAARFGADEQQWLFLTGELPYIRRVGAEVFQLPVDKKFHTERFVLVDPEGKIEGMYSWPEEKQFEKLKENIREMIQSVEKAS